MKAEREKNGRKIKIYDLSAINFRLYIFFIFIEKTQQNRSDGVQFFLHCCSLVLTGLFPLLAQWDGARTIWDLHRDQFFYIFHTHPKRCQTNFHQIVILWISSFAFIGSCFSLSITYPSNCPWTMRLRSSNNNGQPSCVSAGKKGKKIVKTSFLGFEFESLFFFFFFDLDGASGGEVEEAEVRSNKKLMTVSILKHQAFAFITIKNWNLIDLFWCFHWQSLPSTQHTAGSSNNRVETIVAWIEDDDGEQEEATPKQKICVCVELDKGSSDWLECCALLRREESLEIHNRKLWLWRSQEGSLHEISI